MALRSFGASGVLELGRVRSTLSCFVFDYVTQLVVRAVADWMDLVRALPKRELHSRLSSLIVVVVLVLYSSPFLFGPSFRFETRCVKRWKDVI